MDSTTRMPSRGFALALGLVALITPLAVHLFMLCLLPLLFYRRIAVFTFARFSR